MVWVALPGDAAAAFRRRLDDQLVGLVVSEGRLQDLSSGSVFNAESGEAISGPLAGKRLTRMPAMRGYWFTWATFHPETELIP